MSSHIPTMPEGTNTQDAEHPLGFLESFGLAIAFVAFAVVVVNFLLPVTPV